MTTLTTPEAQKFLAEQVKELLQIYNNPSTQHTSIFWKNNDPRFVEAVKNTEWDYIARLVEGKLTFIQLEHYYTELYKIWVEERPVKCRFSLWLNKLDYIQRATALKEILKRNTNLQI